jgi:ABC-type sulfate transport system substrate-binding protein
MAKQKGGGPMNEKQLAKLVKKISGQAAKPKRPPRKTYDAALDATQKPEAGDEEELKDFVKEMKRREF